MERVAKTVCSYFVWAMIFLTCPLFFIPALLIWLVTVPFDRRLRALHLYSCAWAAFYTHLYPYWHVSVRNRERLRSDHAYVVVSNHQSLLDILVLFRLYRHFKWVSKAEIFRLPFIGWNMALNRYIRIRRGDPKDVVRMMAACGDALDSGSSVLIFPEGTRSRDGEIRDFKHGAFTLALRHHVPILPIVLDGTLRALPKSGIVSPGADIVIQVLKPIPVDKFSDVETLRDHVRRIMVERLHAMRAEGLHDTVSDRTARSA
jgi:1-acyl-sn-glycerol-3-phosphate acyltransferase